VVLRERGIENDVVEPADTGRIYRWQAGDGDRIELAVAHDSNAAGPLRDQQCTVRQTSKGPGVIQPAGDHFDMKLPGTAVVVERAGAEPHRGRGAARGARRARRGGSWSVLRRRPLGQGQRHGRSENAGTYPPHLKSPLPGR
jgi:hypothetical protein